jgi:hypothetical protein
MRLHQKSLFEESRAWQHLANAGLIEGSFTGIGGVTVGTTIPASRVSNAGFYVGDMSNFLSGGSTYATDAGKYKHLFMFGAPAGTATTDVTSDPVVTPEEAWNVDKELDDGKPGIGKVTGYGSGFAFTNCGSTADSTAEYDFSQSGTTCAIYFKTDF